MHAVPFETYALPTETDAGTVTVRPLRNGDTVTVQRILERLGERSRRLRFGLAAPALARRELELLAQVDAHRHVLVAYTHDEPIAIAHLVRDVADPHSAEVASAVADGWQRLGVGTALARLMARDAADAGITHVHAVVRLENVAAVLLMNRVTTIVRRFLDAGELHLVGMT